MNGDNTENSLQRGLKNIHDPFSSFIRAQTTSSWALLLATIGALWWANADQATYQNITHTSLGFFIDDFQLAASFKFIVNDGLMVIFFFLLGLEIKREVLAGDLADQDNRNMLIICAIGGMVFPAVIYSLFNWSSDSQIGWGIPIATDTAFAIGILTVIRKHIPKSLLAFLVGLAIVDDVGAILVIAFFYTQDLSIFHLISAFALVLFLGLGNYGGIRQPFFYVIFGVVCWWMMLKSGVHPTLAGVLIALTIPARPQLSTEKQLFKAKAIISELQKQSKPVNVLASRADHEQVLEMREFAERASTPLRRWEDVLGLPVALLILPLFVLTNAGISFNFPAFIQSIQHPTGLGIISGLVLGKFIGITGACWLALRFNIGRLPDDVKFHHVIGISLIAGIGFTMSTFIATLGFEANSVNLQSAKSSILVASIISATLGILYLRFVATKFSEQG